MQKNKITTYLLYALGEIVLVVIGILIAVNINNWNQSRIDRKKELSYLRSYASDLKVNIKELERVTIKSSRMSALADVLIQSFASSGKDIGLDETDSILFELIGYTKYLSQEGTKENVLGAGSLEIIRDLHVRSSFVTHEADLKRMRASEHYAFNVFEEYMDYLKGNIRMYNFQLGKSMLDSDIISSLSSDTYFLNLIDDLSVIYRELNDHYKDRRNALEMLLNAVEAEIEELAS